MVWMKRRSEMNWDGELKNKTKNCIDCKFKIDFDDKEICSWGVAFKYLSGENPSRKCEYFGKEPPKNNSQEYVLYAKKHNIIGRPKTYKNEAARQLKLF
jgi:hypothetical protein